jgi:flagellar hook assembly protein FlgD
MQNHPNPFNPSTEISFVLPQSAHCTIDVYDIAGRRIKTLLNEPVACDEPKSVIWQGDDAQGNPVASGIYYYKMYAGKYTSTKKMILMK